MQSAAARAAPRQRHIERFGGELSSELGVGESVAAPSQSVLELLFRHVDGSPRGRARRRRQFAERFQEIGERAGLAEVLRLRVFELGRVTCCHEIGLRGGDDFFDFVH